MVNAGCGCESAPREQYAAHAATAGAHSRYPSMRVAYEHDLAHEPGAGEDVAPHRPQLDVAMADMAQPERASFDDRPVLRLELVAPVRAREFGEVRRLATAELFRDSLSPHRHLALLRADRDPILVSFRLEAHLEVQLLDKKLLPGDRDEFLARLAGGRSKQFPLLQLHVHDTELRHAVDTRVLRELLGIDRHSFDLLSG